jgi:glycosyltransferase involved in cell wall biosynthesis
MELKGKRLIIGTPAYSGWVHVEYTRSLLQTHALMAQYGLEVRNVFLCQCARITKARNDIVQSFMESDFDHLLMIDADIGWEPDMPVRLIQHDLPIVGAVTVKRGTNQMCIKNIKEGSEDFDYSPERKLLRVGAMGTGVMLIRRDAIVRMERAYPNLRMSEGKGGHPGYAFFSEMLTPNGWLEGEDYSFCQRWRAIGGELFVDPFIHLAHLAEIHHEGSLAQEMKINGRPTEAAA